MYLSEAMNPNQSPIALETFLGMLLVACATAVCVKWIKMPYAVALVLAGLAIGVSRVSPPVSMTPELVLMIFLPALLFEASWNLDAKLLKRDWLAVGTLATIGVVVCMLSVTSILHLVAGLPIHTALLFGAMVSATDPVAVIALFRRMNIDSRLTMLLEGESLFNDGTAVVLFQLVLGIVLSGSHWSLPSAFGEFVVVVLGGATVGALLGYIASRITSAFEDHLLETTLTLVTAYGAFLIAHKLNVSPVISVVAAGIVVGNYGSRTGMSATTRLAVNAFWEYAAFLVNSLLFLLIGLQVQLPVLIRYSQVIGFGLLAVLAARFMVVYGICPFVSTKRLPIPVKWRHLLFWGGLRGALVMALALSLPTTFPDREAIINMTFGVVLFTLLVPGLTMEPLLRLLGMVARRQKAPVFQELKSLSLAYKAELNALSEMLTSNKISQHTFDLISQDLQDRINRLEQQMESPGSTSDLLELRQTRARLIEVGEVRLQELQQQGLLDDDSAQRLNTTFQAELNMIELKPGLTPISTTLPEHDASQDASCL